MHLLNVDQAAVHSRHLENSFFISVSCFLMYFIGNFIDI